MATAKVYQFNEGKKTFFVLHVPGDMLSVIKKDINGEWYVCPVTRVHFGLGINRQLLLAIPNQYGYVSTNGNARRDFEYEIEHGAEYRGKPFSGQKFEEILDIDADAILADYRHSIEIQARIWERS
jgi:hypothetical protein